MTEPIVPGWHRRTGPRPVLLARRGLPDYGDLRWIDHPYRVRLSDGRWRYVAEPYSLDDDDYADLAYLADHGWSVQVTASRARHYPGQTIAIEIEAEP